MQHHAQRLIETSQKSQKLENECNANGRWNAQVGTTTSLDVVVLTNVKAVTYVNKGAAVKQGKRVERRASSVSVMTRDSVTVCQRRMPAPSIIVSSFTL